MEKELITYQQMRGSDDDMSIGVIFGITYDGKIGLNINKTVYTNRYHKDPVKVNEENIDIIDMELSEFTSFVEFIQEWLDLRSHPRQSESFECLDGELSADSNEELATAYGSQQSSSTQTFDSFTVTLDENYITISPDSSLIDELFRIPVARQMESDLGNDLNNIFTLLDFLRDFYIVELPHNGPFEEDSQTNLSSKNKVELIFERFDKIIAQFEDRRGDRPDFNISDEYDMQYLVQGLLKIFFDDVRDESYLKQYAEKNPRIDFLLESQEIGIELKYNGENNTGQNIRDELIIDKDQYRNDSMVSDLIIFIYDPNRNLSNPVEYEKDLEEDIESMTTQVIVVPK